MHSRLQILITGVRTATTAARKALWSRVPQAISVYGTGTTTTSHYQSLVLQAITAIAVPPKYSALGDTTH